MSSSTFLLHDFLIEDDQHTIKNNQINFIFILSTRTASGESMQKKFTIGPVNQIDTFWKCFRITEPLLGEGVCSCSLLLSGSSFLLPAPFNIIFPLPPFLSFSAPFSFFFAPPSFFPFSHAPLLAIPCSFSVYVGPCSFHCFLMLQYFNHVKGVTKTLRFHRRNYFRLLPHVSFRKLVLIKNKDCFYYN